MQGDRVCVALTVHKAKGLQYDRVIIPFTSAKFIRETKSGTSAAVVNHAGGLKVLWEWHPRGSGVLRNHDTADPAAVVDRDESVADETRLLYVAMTRARDELCCVVRRPPRGDQIETWSDLLQQGRGS